MTDPDPTADIRPKGEPAAETALVPWLGGAAAVARVAVAIYGEPEPARMPGRIVDECVEELGAEAAQLHLVDGPGRLRLAAHRNLPPAAAERLARLSFDEPLVVAEAARAREFRLAEPLSRDEANRAISGLAEGRLVALPLFGYGEFQGVLGISRAVTGPLRRESREALGALAELFGVALVESRAREARQRQRLQLEALRQAALAIAGAGDLPTTLRTIADQARRVASAEYAALGIVVADDRPFEPWVFSGLDPEVERKIGTHPRPRGLLGAVPAEGRSIRVEETERDPRFEGFPPEHPRMHAFLGVPIQYEGGILGNLYLTNKLGGGAFTEDDQQAIEILARHAAIAVQQTRDRERIEREVEERRRSEEALRRSEARLERAQEIARLGSWEYDPRTGELTWSAQTYRILGHEPGTFRPSREALLAAVAATERERTRDELERAIERGEPFRFQTRIVRRDGAERVVRLEGRATVGEGGRPLVAGTLQDITGRVRAEEERVRLLALAEERSWLRTVIGRSPVGILLYEGANGERILANRRAEVLFGGAVPAPRPGALLRPDRTPLALAELPGSRALRGETVNAEEFWLARLDGGEVPVLASAAPIHDAGGAVVGAVVTLEDITAIKELARMREEWTSVVAHDLRQPVTTVAAYGALLSRHADATVRHRADQILAATRRLDRMIADLLDFSRLEAHRLSLDLQTVELPPLLRALGERMRVEAPDRELEVLLPPDLPPVRADPARLEQVLANLLSNAVKYGYGGTPIRLEARVEGGFVELSVENRGEGIPPAELPRLFQRFQRSRRVSRVKGIGLGLYIARGIVEAHGGQIRAESVPGESTTFRFTVPIAPGDGAVSDAAGVAATLH